MLYLRASIFNLTAFSAFCSNAKIHISRRKGTKKNAKKQ
jgi:hypothetical protein